jgi:hypothetical protein
VADAKLVDALLLVVELFFSVLGDVVVLGVVGA